jgi:hypothetical protein
MLRVHILPAQEILPTQHARRSVFTEIGSSSQIRALCPSLCLYQYKRHMPTAGIMTSQCFVSVTDLELKAKNGDVSHKKNFSYRQLQKLPNWLQENPNERT